MRNRVLPPPAAVGFLLPNFVGLVAFVLFPVGLSLVMAFTNWSLKPGVGLQFVGLRNFQDLLGVRAVGGGDSPAVAGYFLLAAGLVLGVILAMWANFALWCGLKITGWLLAGLGLAMVTKGTHDASLGTAALGIVSLLCGLAAPAGGRQRARGRALGRACWWWWAVGLWLSAARMWSAYELRDGRFWQYFHNTAFLMMGIPLGIAGSLGLAMLVNESCR